MSESPIFGEEHRLLREQVRRFVAREVSPHGERWERDGFTPREVLRRMGALGLLGMRHPPRHGGGGLDARASVILAEELGRREGVFNAPDVVVFCGDVMSASYLLRMARIAEDKLLALADGKAGKGGGGGKGAKGGKGGADALDPVRLRALALDNEDARFYFNKIKTAEHYVFQILPRTKGIAAKVQSRNFAALAAVPDHLTVAAAALRLARHL